MRIYLKSLRINKLRRLIDFLVFENLVLQNGFGFDRFRGVRPHSITVQYIGLSSRRSEFDSPWGHCGECGVMVAREVRDTGNGGVGSKMPGGGSIPPVVPQ